MTGGGPVFAMSIMAPTRYQNYGNQIGPSIQPRIVRCASLAVELCPMSSACTTFLPSTLATTVDRLRHPDFDAMMARVATAPARPPGGKSMMSGAAFFFLASSYAGSMNPTRFDNRRRYTPR